MTYQENEYPGFIKVLNQIKKRLKNPVLINKVIEEALKIYKTIPIYPGLVTFNIKTMLSDAKHIKKGAWLGFSYNGNYYGGKVKSVSKGEIVLDEILEVKKVKNMKVKREHIKDARIVIENKLKQDWPMLFFSGTVTGIDNV